VLQFHTICVEETVFVPATGGVGTTVSTVRVALAMALHPAPLVTVIVYVVLDVGLSVIAAVLSPVLHK
jgi:fluoride ion exporter CrcB/FEX